MNIYTNIYICISDIFAHLGGLAFPEITVFRVFFEDCFFNLWCDFSNVNPSSRSRETCRNSQSQLVKRRVNWQIVLYNISQLAYCTI